MAPPKEPGATTPPRPPDAELPLPDPPLRNEQIGLRPWRTDDAPMLVHAWSDEQMQRWNPVPDNRGLAAARLWIGREGNRRRAGISLDLAVVEAEHEPAALGEVGLRSVDRARGAALIGWWLVPEARGRGYATAAVALLTDWGHNQLGLRSIVAEIHPDNHASIAVARRAGYRYLGRVGRSAPDAFVSRAGEPRPAR